MLSSVLALLFQEGVPQALKCATSLPCDVAVGAGVAAVVIAVAIGASATRMKRLAAESARRTNRAASEQLSSLRNEFPMTGTGARTSEECDLVDVSAFSHEVAPAGASLIVQILLHRINEADAALSLAHEAGHSAQCRDAFALNAAAIAQMNAGQFESALESFQNVLTTFHELASEDKERREYYAAGYHLACEARAWVKVAEVQELIGVDLVAALNSLRQALALQESVQGAPTRCEPRLHFRALPTFRADKAETHKAIGDVLKSRGEYAEALRSYEQALREHAGNVESVKHSIARVRALLAAPGTASRV